jgi:putative transposase
MSKIREKNHRLPTEAYRGFVRAAFTAKLDRNQPFFVTEDRFKEQELLLLRALRELQCESELYLFMPDHLHVIITGTSPESDCRSAMAKFKQYSGYAFSQQHHLAKWQKDFYDHIFRQEEDLRTPMVYILNNPIRAGLCESWDDYLYKGSTVFDVRTFGKGNRSL